MNLGVCYVVLIASFSIFVCLCDDIVLGGVLHQSHLLLSGMVHFITQLQYYLNFEVRWGVNYIVCSG